MSTGNSLFKNPMVEQAMRIMKTEDREKFKRWGDFMYNRVDYEQREKINSLDPSTEEKVMYVVESLNSGLHPRYLKRNELEIITNYYGKEWYKKWDYTKKDIPEYEQETLKLRNDGIQ